VDNYGIDCFKAVTGEVCAISRDIAKHYFKKSASDLSLQLKSDASPVTIADLTIEEKIRKLITGKFPEHGIIGEEQGAFNEKAEWIWTVDPIDGTKSFITGVPLFTTLLALSYQGNPIAGLIYQPILDELVWGDTQSTFFNGKKTQMRERAKLAEATLLTTDIAHIREYHSFKNFEGLIQKTRFTRTWGDGYGYLLLATGNADIMIDPVMNPWDLLALIPVIQGAGGIISSWDGNAASTGKSIVAANKDLHPLVIQQLNLSDGYGVSP